MGANVGRAGTSVRGEYPGDGGSTPEVWPKSLEDEPAIMVLVMLEEAWSEEGRALVVRRGARMIRAGAGSGVAHG